MVEWTHLQIPQSTIRGDQWTSEIAPPTDGVFREGRDTIECMIASGNRTGAHGMSSPVEREWTQMDRGVLCAGEGRRFAMVVFLAGTPNCKCLWDDLQKSHNLSIIQCGLGISSKNANTCDWLLFADVGHPQPSTKAGWCGFNPHYESAFAFVVGSLFVHTDGGPSLIDVSQMTVISTLCKLCGKRPHSATLVSFIHWPLLDHVLCVDHSPFFFYSLATFRLCSMCGAFSFLLAFESWSIYSVWMSGLVHFFLPFWG